MKKLRFLFFAVLTCSLITFNSCSGDDENGDIGATKLGTSILYIDGNRMNTESQSALIFNSIQYDKSSTTFPTPEISFVVAWGNDGESALFNFEGINLNDLNVGDNLTDICSKYGYQIDYNNNVYWLMSNLSNYSDLKDWRGQFIVKELNSDKTEIKVDFENVKIPILNSSLKPDKTKFISIKGSMKYKIDF